MDKDKKQYQEFSRRSFLIGTMQFGLLSVLSGRLFWLQMIQGQKYQTLSDQNRIDTDIIIPPRGEIVDRYGVPLAINIRNFTLQVIAERTPSMAGLLKAIQGLVPIDNSVVTKILKQAAQSPSFLPLEVRNNLTWEEVSTLEVHSPELPGMVIEEGAMRSYPYDQVTAHLVGYVGAVSEKDKKENKDKDPLLARPSFRIGKSGIERAFEQKLRGKAGAAQMEVNVKGRPVRELTRLQDFAGERVQLTLDAELQRILHERLSQEISAAAVVMDAYTGAIYAMQSYPSFDPNLFVNGISHTAWDDLMGNPARPLNHKATVGQYPPGSTFKMITALAGLRQGIITEHTTQFCGGSHSLGRDKFHCWKKEGHGTMNLETALEQSCDVFFYKMAVDLGIDALSNVAKEFGFNSLTGIEIEEETGFIPTKEWKMANFGSKWQAGESIVASIGQGYITVTPLQNAVMTARMVNGGYAVTPHVIQCVGKECHIDKDITQFQKLNFPPEHLALIQRGMQRVTMSERGTAYSKRIKDVGFEMGGKTGTSQVKRITKSERRLGVKNEDLDWKYRHHALFVGYAPIARPRYVCSVIVEHGNSGSAAAAPIARDILLEVQKRDPAKHFS